MSATYVHLKLVCKDADIAKELAATLKTFDPKTTTNTSALAAVFAEPTALSSISVDGVRAKAEVVSFDYQDASQAAELSETQLQAWQDLGVSFIHFNGVDSQSDAEATEYYHGLRLITAKEFKAREVSSDVPDPKKVVTLANQGGDAKVANSLKNGVNVNALVDGMPLFVHLISAKYPLTQTMEVLAKQSIDWRLGLPWAQLFVSGFAEFPAHQIAGLTKAMLQSAGPDLATLLRHESIWALLLALPDVLTWVCQQDGIPLNLPLLHANPSGWSRFGRLDTSSRLTEQYCNCGSILYYLGEGRTDNFVDQIAKFLGRTTQHTRAVEDVLAEDLLILQRYGATANAPEGHSIEQQFIHYLLDVDGAPSLHQLVDAGFNLQKPLRDGALLLELAREYPQDWPSKMRKINELLIAGADASHWLAQKDFQQTLLVYLFDKSYRFDVTPKIAAKFAAEEQPAVVVSILAQMAKRGLALKKPMKLWIQGKDALNYQGSLLGAVALLICSRHSDLRSWCLPLVELLLAQGCSGQDIVECVPESSAFSASSALTLAGKWDAMVSTFSFSAKATILERLKQRQALRGFDDIDEAVIQRLEAQ